MTTRVFVYGTLKRGLRNARYLAGQRFIGEARTEPVYRMVNLGVYPGMFEVAEDGRQIRGEIWEVDEACKMLLDQLEDVEGGEYRVEVAKLQSPYPGELIWTYLYARDVSQWPDAGEEWRDP